MKKYKYVGSKWQADEYVYPQPVVGSIYEADDKIGDERVEYWVTESTDDLSSEWEEVISGKDFMSVSIVTYKGEKEITIEFSTNDLGRLKSFVNNLS